MTTRQTPTFTETINLSEEEQVRVREYAEKLLAKTAIGVVTYPLTFAKTLFQLGHEPFPLTVGKVFVVAGRETYFLPNALKYLKNVYDEAGVRTIYTGLDAGILANVTGGIFSFAADLYLDRYYPTLGGSIEPKKEEIDEEDLTDHESFKLKLREAIRDTVSRSVGIIVSRPLVVVMVREIAQLVGHEYKYTSVISALLRIGREEGPKGYFQGLVPALIAELVTIWGSFALRYALERALVKAQDGADEAAKKSAKDSRKLFNFVVPFVINSFSYPFALISTVMSLNGSGLAVSLLPYSPTFSHWSDAYDYFKPQHGLTRGARLFLREQKGAVSVGSNHELYASNKHFV
uniref:Mitochondrial carrier n=1 Tax=Panagrellus redivivus TaxID=6233 RepID=A0A7E4VRX4_PANRE